MSHGSSEEENYWPGYVDALTSMVQVLAFVMMMLAMAVFILSQNVSKVAVQGIAKAMKVTVPDDATVSELTKLIVEAAEKGPTGDKSTAKTPTEGKAPEAAAGAAQTPAKAAADGKDQQTAAAAGAAQTPAKAVADGKDQQTAAAAGASQTPAKAVADGKDQQTAAAAGAAQTPANAVADGKGQEAAVAGDAQNSAKTPSKGKEQEVAAADSSDPTVTQPLNATGAQVASLSKNPTQRAAASIAATEGKQVSVHFADQSFDLAEDEKKKLEAFLTDSKMIESGASFVVQAYATGAKESVSQSRRSAFYRAMKIRSQLLANKADQGKIKIKVLDDRDKSRENVVAIIAE